MTGSGLSETKTDVTSALAVAHLVFKAADLKRSCQFYSDLGIPPFFIEDEIAIVELRGGTHLILLEVDQLAVEGVAASLTGQFHEKLSEQFDLMIEGSRHFAVSEWLDLPLRSLQRPCIRRYLRLGVECAIY